MMREFPRKETEAANRESGPVAGPRGVGCREAGPTYFVLGIGDAKVKDASEILWLTLKPGSFPYVGYAVLDFAVAGVAIPHLPETDAKILG